MRAGFGVRASAKLGNAQPVSIALTVRLSEPWELSVQRSRKDSDCPNRKGHGSAGLSRSHKHCSIEPAARSWEPDGGCLGTQFLDYTKSWSPVAYLGLFVLHWVFFGVVALLKKLKEWALPHTAHAAQVLPADGKAGKIE
jgi:hypothetical protein